MSRGWVFLDRWSVLTLTKDRNSRLKYNSIQEIIDYMRDLFFFSETPQFIKEILVVVWIK